MGLLEEYAGQSFRIQGGPVFFFEPKYYPREQVDADRVAEFADILRSGAQPFPPITLATEPGPGGRLVVVDGVHRTIAAVKAGKIVAVPTTEIVAAPDGIFVEAVRRASTSSKPLSRAEKRTDVLRLLNELGGWGDRRIAAIAGVSHTFVSTLRAGNVATSRTNMPPAPAPLATAARPERALDQMPTTPAPPATAAPPAGDLEQFVRVALQAARAGDGVYLWGWRDDRPKEMSAVLDPELDAEPEKTRAKTARELVKIGKALGEAAATYLAR